MRFNKHSIGKPVFSVVHKPSESPDSDKPPLWKGQEVFPNIQKHPKDFTPWNGACPYMPHRLQHWIAENAIFTQITPLSDPLTPLWVEAKFENDLK